MSTEYRTLSFIPKYMPAADSLDAEVVDANAGICYLINAFSDAAFIYHVGRPSPGGRLIVVFRPFAGEEAGKIQTVASRGTKAELVRSLLTSLSACVLLLLSSLRTRTIRIAASFRTRKVTVLTTSCLRSGWRFTTTAYRSWFLACLGRSVLPHAQYAIPDPLVGHDPLARLRIVDGVITLEVNMGVKLRSEWCDCIVAGVFLVCLNRDAWVEDALLCLR
ncbi:hypothetical protein HYPSUDRAFT_207082 [Hypholoma sublateritium FD-334 SS-4]|uniref:Uncharacterized protein n=1 Tax=Hypholoma sublateritium (strain FD-334 SS-4) TaxID=945553 RepID=A0A0D2KP32_HYPSF|nr:hypothetical protein HYPSUDRAFT_207082 [Hypholoma sublateritium FD-334 SS-4]